MLPNFTRATRHHPCPVCGKPDWCLLSRETGPGGAPLPIRVLCQRSPSAKRWGEAGWLHELASNPSAELAHRRRALSPAPIATLGRAPPDGRGHAAADFGAMADAWRSLVEPAELDELSRELGVSSHALRRLRIGRVDGAMRCWAFPMRGPFGEVRGIRLRADSGRKWSVKGGREGLFMADEPSALHGPGAPTPSNDPDRRLYIAEGPTDTAALLDRGLEAVGRPSCTGALTQLRALVHGLEDGRGVVIVADNDGPGLRGAESLAAALRDDAARTGRSRTISIITPPGAIKDAREWKQVGWVGWPG